MLQIFVFSIDHNLMEFFCAQRIVDATNFELYRKHVAFQLSDTDSFHYD